jgi:outer membrane protein, heavy metal efflux system
MLPYRFLRALPLTLGLALSACGSAEPSTDLAEVSEELRARTGHALDVAGAGAEDVAESDALPPDVALSDGLDEGEAVAIALWRSPEFAVILAELDLSLAELVEAGLLRDPVFSFLFPFGPKQYEWTITLPLEFLLQRPRRIEIAQLDLERSGSELVRHGLDLAREVRVACIEAEAAAERERIAGLQGSCAAELARIAEERARRGDAGEAELERARLAVVRAELERARLAAESSSARLALEALLGIDLDPGLAIHSDATSVSAEIEPARLLSVSLAARPEVRAAELALEAAAEGVGLAHLEAWKFSAILDANEKGTDGFEMGPGLALTPPLLSGGRGGSARSEARLERAARVCRATGARVRAEVRAASASYASSLEQRQEHRERVEAVAERLHELGQRTYALGASAPGERVELELGVLAARREGLDLEARCRRARAELERSLGCRLEHLLVPTPEAPTAAR